MAEKSEAIIVGAGPNGLAAAITLARRGFAVTVFEEGSTIGGGARSGELTIPGFTHDICSAVHPLGCGSPFFRQLPLADFGLEWIHPAAPLAHPLEDGTAVLLERSIELTAQGLGSDARAYRRLVTPLARRWDQLGPMILRPLLQAQRHPCLLARFGLPALLPAQWLASMLFKEDRARALLAGTAAHSMLSLKAPISSSFGLVLALLAHAVGWPIARGGSQRIPDAMAAYLVSLGGRVVTEKRINALDEAPKARITLLDITPRQLLPLAAGRLPSSFENQLRRFRYGPGVFKLDYALDAPVPWKAKDCLRAATVHIGGTLEQIVASESSVARGSIPERPFVIAVQPSLFDPSRAPDGKHTLWAYCHVPNGSAFDMTERIEAQIQRYAPGFKDRILARNAMAPVDFAKHDENYVGGDINGGIMDIRQLITRPTRRLNPYSTPIRGLYVCSASTPPGGGVHGMCGYNAALSALYREA